MWWLAVPLFVSAGANLFSIWEQKKYAEETSKFLKQQYEKYLQGLQASYDLSIFELERWYKQSYAQSFSKEREALGTIQAYYGARGVELWGSAMLKAMQTFNVFDKIRRELYHSVLTQKRRLDIGLKSESAQLMTQWNLADLKSQYASPLAWSQTFATLGQTAYQIGTLGLRMGWW